MSDLVAIAYPDLDTAKAVMARLEQQQAEKVLALPVDVKASDFSPTAAGATLTLTANGRSATTATGKAIPPAPVPITVEFLSGTGSVVATQDATVPQLASGASQEVKVSGQGSGIAAWRYKRK